MKKISLVFVIIATILLLPVGNIFASEENGKTNNVQTNEIITNSESTKENYDKKDNTNSNENNLINNIEIKDNE